MKAQATSIAWRLTEWSDDHVGTFACGFLFGALTVAVRFLW